MFKFFIFIALFFKCLNLKAHHKIYSPRVEEGRQSLEWRGHFNYDDRLEFNKSHHHVFETEYSWTSFWQSELEFHVSDKDETPLDWEKTEFQNQVQVLDYKNFAGAFYFSYNFVSEQDEPDEIEYKYLNEFNNEYATYIRCNGLHLKDSERQNCSPIDNYYRLPAKIVIEFTVTKAVL